MGRFANQFEQAVATVGDHIFVWRNRRSARAIRFNATSLTTAWQHVANFDWRRAATLGLDKPRSRWPRAITIGAVVVCGVSFVRIGLAVSDDAASPASDYFFDLESGKLSVIPIDRAPTQVLPDGTEAVVRGYVFSCGVCSDATQRQTRYLERMPPSAYAIAVAGPQNEGDAYFLRTSAELAAVTGDTLQWVARSSQEGQAIIQAARGGCERSNPVQCLP